MSVLKFLLFIPILIATSVFGGFALSQAWEWFVVPLGTPAISVVHGMGIYAIVAFCNARSLIQVAKQKTDLWVGPFVSVIASLVLLGWGWTLHQYM